MIMSYQQSAISQDPKLLYNQALISQEKNDDRLALSYYTQSLTQIRSIDSTIVKIVTICSPSFTRIITKISINFNLLVVSFSICVTFTLNMMIL